MPTLAKFNIFLMYLEREIEHDLKKTAKKNSQPSRLKKFCPEIAQVDKFK